MEILNYIHSHIVKIAYMYTLVFLGFVLWVFILVTNNVATPDNSQIPELSMDKIESVYQKVDERKKFDVPAYTKLSPGDFGRDEPFR